MVLYGGNTSRRVAGNWQLGIFKDTHNVEVFDGTSMDRLTVLDRIKHTHTYIYNILVAISSTESRGLTPPKPSIL